MTRKQLGHCTLNNTNLDHDKPGGMSTTSKLTSLTATPTTPRSYPSADDSTSQPDNGTVTETSSPVTLGANRQLYRDARQLLRELRDHTTIYLEEQLCMFA
jgi:hypothetical protein